MTANLKSGSAQYFYGIKVTPIKVNKCFYEKKGLLKRNATLPGNEIILVQQYCFRSYFTAGSLDAIF